MFFPFWPWGDNNNVKYYHLASRVGWFPTSHFIYISISLGKISWSFVILLFFFSFVRSFLLTCLFYFFLSFVSLYSNRCFPFFSPSIASLRSIPHMTDHSFVFLHYPQTFSINKPTGLSFTFAHLRSHPIISSTVSFSNTLQHPPPTPYHIVVRVSSVPSSASAVIN